jgi:hypothetical protein
MKVLYTDKPVFIPTMTLEEIEQKYVKGRSRWKFDDWVDDDRSEANHHIEETVMMNLMYFGLGGDETAERMFKAFYPEGTTTSEWSSFLRSWYDQTKAEKKP